MTTPASAKRVAMACLVGTAIESYDFFIYGTASALVLPKLFLPSFDPAAGTLLSFSTFALATVEMLTSTRCPVLETGQNCG